MCCGIPETDTPAKEKQLVIPIRDLICPVISSVALTDSVTKIILGVPKDFEYKAGQYIEVILDDFAAAPLSIACAPIESSILELHLNHEKGNALAQAIMQAVHSNAELPIRGPFGHCTAAQFSLDRPIIFLVRGTGLAPAKALIEELSKLESYAPMHLYWSASAENDLYQQALPQQWQQQLSHFQYTPVLTRAASNWSGRVGYLEMAVLEDYLDLSNHQVYASGPENMVFAALNTLQERGLSQEWFYSDCCAHPRVL